MVYTKPAQEANSNPQFYWRSWRTIIRYLKSFDAAAIISSEVTARSEAT